MFQKRLLLLLLACSFSSLCKCFFLSKMYNTIVRKQVGVKTSCDGPSSLKTQTSVLYPLKTKYSSNSLKKIFFYTALTFKSCKVLKRAASRNTNKTSFLQEKTQPDVPITASVVAPDGSETGTVAVPKCLFPADRLKIT